MSASMQEKSSTATSMISTPLSVPRGGEEAIEETKAAAAGLKKGRGAGTIACFPRPRQDGLSAPDRRAEDEPWGGLAGRFQSLRLRPGLGGSQSGERRFGGY